MIKVLHFISNISNTNGMMQVIMNYYRNLDTKRVQFGFLYFDERETTYGNEIKALGGEIFKVPRPSDIARFRASLDRIAAEIYGQYDILHVHEFYMPVLLKDFQKKAGIKKLVVHAHVTKFSNGKTISSLRNWLFSRCNYFAADHYMASSQKAGHSIFGKDFDRRGVVINNAINTGIFRPQAEIRENIRERYGIKNDLVIGHVGNMYPPKNHSFILDVFAEAEKMNKNIKLLLVGDGVLKAGLEQKSRELGIADKVIFAGKRTDIEKYLQAMDVFIFPSVFEGLGIAMIEAQAAGLPCVYSDVIPNEANIIKEQNTAMNLNAPLKNWAISVLGAGKKIPYSRVEELINDAGYNIALEADHLIAEYEKILSA